MHRCAGVPACYGRRGRQVRSRERKKGVSSLSAATTADSGAFAVLEHATRGTVCARTAHSVARELFVGGRARAVRCGLGISRRRKGAADDDAVSDTEVAASVSSVLWPSKHGWISNKKLNAGTCVWAGS